MRGFMEDGQRDDNILIVDALNLAFRWKWGKAKEFADDYVATVQSLARSYKCGTVLVTADWGNSTYRKSMFPEYKQNRREKAEQQTPEEKEAFEEFFAEYERTLEIMPWEVFRYKGVEADDLAGYLTKKLKHNRIWLVSSDRDWNQLVNDSVSQFCYNTRREVTPNTWPYDYPMESFISVKCLQGDMGDNVPGVEGCGPVRAWKLISEFGDVFGLISSLPLEGSAKYIQAVNESEDLLYRNFQLFSLVDFCEDAIGLDNIQDIDRRCSENRLF